MLAATSVLQYSLVGTANASRIAVYAPVFQMNAVGQPLLGVLTQGFFVNDILSAALIGVDNNTVQLLWTDVTLNTSVETIYELNANAPKLGSQYYSTTTTFAQRVYMFTFRDVDQGDSSLPQNAAILGALLFIEVVLIIATVLFVRNR
jgi:hypothetical protein